MKIECLLRRPGGTTVTLDDTTYRFVPDDKGRDVAEITTPKHIDVLVAIPEGYRIVHDEKQKPPHDNLDDMDRSALEELHMKLLGGKPKAGTKKEDMVAAIRAKKAEDAA